MPVNIVIIQGHPDARGGHLCHALADAYAKGAGAAGHAVRRIEIGALAFPLIRTREDWATGQPPPDIRAAQEAIAWAGHIVIVYPLWLGTMPALLKAFLEQTARPGFAVAPGSGPKGWRKLLAGRSARVVVTMGIPALVYRWWFGAHSLKSLERNILNFVGIRPVRESLFGMVEQASDATRARWLEKMQALGARGR
jgi:putative NADPH-quinone reductase